MKLQEGPAFGALIIGMGFAFFINQTYYLPRFSRQACARGRLDARTQYGDA